MTVDDLRKALEGVRGDLLVVTNGSDHSYDSITHAEVIPVCKTRSARGFGIHITEPEPGQTVGVGPAFFVGE